MLVVNDEYEWKGTLRPQIKNFDETIPRDVLGNPIKNYKGLVNVGARNKASYQYNQN